jgi:hypothetical protein
LLGKMWGRVIGQKMVDHRRPHHSISKKHMAQWRGDKMAEPGWWRRNASGDKTFGASPSCFPKSERDKMCG